MGLWSLARAVPRTPLGVEPRWGRARLHLLLCVVIARTGSEVVSKGLSLRRPAPPPGASCSSILVVAAYARDPFTFSPRDGSAVSSSLIVPEFRYKAFQNLKENLTRQVCL